SGLPLGSRGMPAAMAPLAMNAAKKASQILRRSFNPNSRLLWNSTCASADVSRTTAGFCLRRRSPPGAEEIRDGQGSRDHHQAPDHVVPEKGNSGEEEGPEHHGFAGQHGEERSRAA